MNVGVVIEEEMLKYKKSPYVVGEETHNIKSWKRSRTKKPIKNKMKEDKDDEKHTKTNVERIEMNRN